MKKFLVSLLLFFTAFILSAGKNQWQFCWGEKYSADAAQKISVDGAMPADRKSFVIPENKFFSFRSFTKKLYYSRSKISGIAYRKFEFALETTVNIGIGAKRFYTLFINGKKIGSNEPAGTFTARTHATNYIHKVIFRKGVNHVAAHLRPGAIGWEFAFEVLPDFSKLPENKFHRDRLMEQLFPPAVPGLLAKECLYYLSSDRAAFTFEFGKPEISGITYRKASEPADASRTVWSSRFGIKNLAEIHRVELNDLAPATEYLYDVVTYDMEKMKTDKVSSGKFTTFPAKGTAVDFIVTGDTQIDTRNRVKALQTMLNEGGGKTADFFVSLGDVAESFDNFRAVYFTSFYDVLPKSGFFKPAFFVRGNHEYRGAESRKYSDYFGRSNYSFRHGDVFFIVLDSGEDKAVIARPGHSTLRLDTAAYLAEQRRWIKELIESPECKTAKYRIVMAHASPLSCHNRYFVAVLRKYFGEFFYGSNPKCRIDLWIAGHVHAPFHYDPIPGKLYMAEPVKKKIPEIKEIDRQDIRFPIIVNDGPGGAGHTLSVTRVVCSPDNIKVIMTTPDGKLIHEAILQPDKPAKITNSTLKTY